MKRKALSLLLMLVLMLSLSAQAEKVSSLPAAVTVTYTTEQELRGKKEDRFVYKDKIKTALPEVDAEINGLVDWFDENMSETMQAHSNPKRNARLDVHVVHSVCGVKCLSFLVLSRETYCRKQVQSPFITCVYDMETGAKITLNDLFAEDSPAWDILRQAVREGLEAYFPSKEADPDQLDTLTTREAIEQASFMLNPVTLSFHYEARLFYEDVPSLMRITVPYHKLTEYMTDYGREITDNSMYKLVALTFDDGPAYSTSATTLNNLRHQGAIGTFFLTGERISEYEDIALRENDENHSLQSHHWKHTDATKSTPARIQIYTENIEKALTELIGKAPLMMRPPYGLDQPFIAAQINLPIILWDVDTHDWNGKGPGAVLSFVKQEIREGSIVLMHDIKEKSPEAALRVSEWLKSAGYLSVSVEDLFEYYGQEMKANHSYFKVTVE